MLGIRPHALRTSLLVALAGATLACGDGPTGPRVGDIVFQPTELRLRQKEIHRVAVSVTDADGSLLTGVAVTFESSNPGIVTVSSIGEVASVGPAGSATIRATARGFTKALPVVVEGIATSLRITPSATTMPQKGTVELRAQVLDLVEDAIPGQPLKFSTLTPEIVTVNPAGVVTSVGPHGVGHIVVQSGDLYAEAQVTVTQVATTLGVTPATLVLARASGARLNGAILDAVGVAMPGTHAFTFATGDAGVATVDEQGMVRSADRLGETTVTVRSGALVATVPVRVAEVAHPVGQIAATIPLPGAFGVAFARSGVPYAVSMSSGLARLDLDAATATLVAPGVSGLDLAITGDGGHAFVARLDAGAVELVDLATGQTLRTSPHLGNAALTDLLSPDERTLWVGTGRGVAVLDAASLAVLQRFDDVGGIVHLARHPSQPYVYASSNYGTVLEIDVETRSVRRRFEVGSRTQGVVVSKDGAELYVADEHGPLRVVALGSGVMSSIEMPTGGYGVAMSPDGLRLYVSQSMSSSLTIIDLAARQRVGTLSLPGAPRRIAMNAAGTVLLVALESGGVVVVR